MKFSINFQFIYSKNVGITDLSPLEELKNMTHINRFYFVCQYFINIQYHNHYHNHLHISF